ncbi:Bax inhibitor-1/YccA family protein [Orenia marismortui]|uniref:Bax inhibitor-1/YccA family protein n=1 Tax=Orenia marismortui TaxID=46469 RepID=UPI000371892F|nr:Bax inhibitor-1/YccA family protein [Orenia marismortui]
METQLNVAQIETEQRNFIRNVYSWMALALVITAIVAIGTISSRTMLMMILGNNVVFYGLLIGEILLVMFLSSNINKMSAGTAVFSFIAYSVLNGLTISVIFLLYTGGSIVSTFFIAASIFAFMSVYGYYTDNDLSNVGSICLMGLFGLIIASIINIFFYSSILYWITTYAGVVIFTALTAYDTQKIKKMNVLGNEGTDEDKKESIIGALVLYLDFINLFLYLLRIFGRKK